jgi:hypothetical protein
VVTDGPPIYRWIGSLPRDEYLKLIKLAENNALRLADNVDLLIIDHHLLRCWEGVEWLQHLKDKTDNIMCAAEYMRKPILLLEAWRPLLYKYFEIDKKWFHKRYNEYVNSTIFKSITNDLVEELKVYTRKHKSFIIPINVIEDILEEIKIKYDFA